MKLYEQEAKHLGATLLSYVDDGTIIVQSKDWTTNLTVLKEAYGGGFYFDCKLSFKEHV